MWNPWQWAAASNERAVVNAREAATACSRRRVERLEVELFLESLIAPDRSAASLSS
ncbi:hypothetical protein [Nocardioides psychrotolerans]|uniref:hypothetical protein n=1 Tax=Nocardioides psychrotolerans TaxID=1005945 RepID=UPI003137FA30